MWTAGIAAAWEPILDRLFKDDFVSNEDAEQAHAHTHTHVQTSCGAQLGLELSIRRRRDRSRSEFLPVVRCCALAQESGSRGFGLGPARTRTKSDEAPPSAVQPPRDKCRDRPGGTWLQLAQQQQPPDARHANKPILRKNVVTSAHTFPSCHTRGCLARVSSLQPKWGQSCVSLRTQVVSAFRKLVADTRLPSRGDSLPDKVKGERDSELKVHSSPHRTTLNPDT
ncbi:unnamed protein product [Protopolystoma xenopodis]|uniref:Uncharacterized protein n=1 Tax=Protopolystoma xenopodis TaxID=117903 RepID=A0A3S5A9V6_9PLAT|nr:unnamed protein product [Protopolystoma xenopodis]